LVHEYHRNEEKKPQEGGLSDFVYGGSESAHDASLIVNEILSMLHPGPATEEIPRGVSSLPSGNSRLKGGDPAPALTNEAIVAVSRSGGYFF
jgi:hypothetical protein